MTTTHGLTPISATPKMQYLLELIKSPELDNDMKRKEIFYEHRVASWGVTMANKAFSGDQWIFTPEKLNPMLRAGADASADAGTYVDADARADAGTYAEVNTGPGTHKDNDDEDPIFKKKPDYTVEEFITADGKKTTVPVLIMEFKSRTGDRFEKALKQTVFGLSSYMDDKESIDVYIVIIRHTKIGFFEFHGNTEDVGSTVESLWGCTSLTQPLILDKRKEIIMQNVPNDLLPVYYDLEKLKTESKTRRQAREYTIPCVFDLERHGQQIDFLFHYMSTHKPRAGPDFHDLPSDNDNEDSDDHDDSDDDDNERG